MLNGTDDIEKFFWRVSYETPFLMHSFLTSKWISKKIASS